MVGTVGITGTPGTGKKSVAPLVAKRLALDCFSLNDLARDLGVLAPGDEGVVDTTELRRKLRLKRPAVVYGHLLPYSVQPRSVFRVAVLRCEPAALKRRLEGRGYPAAKVIENVEAELIGLESSDAFEGFGPDKTFEVDTTDVSPAESAERVVAALGGRVPPVSRIDWIDRYDTGAKLRSLLSAPGS